MTHSDEFNPLLPCRHCESMDTVVRYNDSGFPDHARCNACDAVGGWVWGKPGTKVEAMERLLAGWNTRVIDGHRVRFHREKPGVIAPDACWVVVSGDYMYGPYTDWRNVCREITQHWKANRCLVG